MSSIADSRDAPFVSPAWRYLLVFLVLPNLVFILASPFVFMVRPPINIDYLLLGIFAPWLGVHFAALGLALFVLGDIIISVGAPTFNFSAASVTEAFAFVNNLDLVYLGTIAVATTLGVSLFGFVGGMLLPSVTRRVPVTIVMLLSATTVAAADIGLSLNRLSDSSVTIVNWNIATSTAVNFAGGVSDALRGRNKAPLALGVASASSPIFERLDAGSALPPRIVLVVVETLGLFRETAANDVQLGALSDSKIGELYDVTIGSVPFVGSTVSGELRELCRLRINSSAPNTALLPVEDCLPALLGGQGYASIAAHGFHGATFSRSVWYPGLNFDRAVFGPDLYRETGASRKCGVNFAGLCDSDAASWLRDQLVDPTYDRLFAYWLTLNGHLPARRPKHVLSSTDCTLSAATAGSDDICFLVQYHDIVLTELSKIALDPELPSTAFIIVGDHAPPFSSQTLRGLFEQGEVPFVILWPKSTMKGAMRAAS